MNIKTITPQKRKYLIYAAIGVIILLIILLLAPLLSQKTKQPLPPITQTTQPMPSVTPTLIPDKDYVAGHVNAKFKQDIPQSVINEKLKQNNARIIETIKEINVSILEVPPGKEQEVTENLIKDGIVKYAELDYMYKPDQAAPVQMNDPEMSKQWHLKTMKVPEAWTITKGAGVKVAVIDSGGGDGKHPDLAANVLETSGTNDHGTHIAGIVGAVGNNSLGIVGVCPECKLLVVDSSYSSSSIAKASLTAIDKGAKVVSFSFGGGSGQTLGDAITAGWNKGTIFTCSAGNDNTSAAHYPSDFEFAVGVASTTSSDAKSSFSNYGTKVEVAAPGSSIYSTLPSGKYGNMSGTSMAAPMAAGVVALIWSTSYGTSPQAVVDRLCNTADKISGTGSNWKCGRINAYAAVQGSTGAPGAPAQPGQPTQATQPGVLPGQPSTPATSSAPGASTVPAQPTTSPATPTPSQTAGGGGGQPIAGGGIPSAVCLGACPTQPATSPTTVAALPQGGGGQPTTQPTTPPQTQTGGGQPVVQPTNTPQPIAAGGGGGGGGAGGGGGQTGGSDL